MVNKIAGTMLLLGALISLAPVVSHAEHNGPGTLIETRPFETDGNITAKVKELYATDKMLKGRDIKVSTDHANVTLTGTVKSQVELFRAAAMVSRIPEVDKVYNKLKVGHD
jgi:osmotically-inducible protein OsmY